MISLFMKRLTPLLLGLACLVALISTGCTSVVKCAPYPSAEAWTPEVKKLGIVTADSGKWPLSLHSVPPDYTFYAALRSVASGTYGVPESEIVLGEVTVQIGAELDGTIRDWKATAEAGQKSGAPVSVGKTPSEALLELKKLLDAGAITQEEYAAKKKSLLEKL